MSHVTVAEHRAAILEVLRQRPAEAIPPDRTALGRRLATDLLAADDLPRFDNSAMDGYAVAPASEDQRDFPVVGDVAAGDPADFRVETGEAARIMTGARVPLGASAVVPVERTDAAPTGPAPAHVSVEGPIVPGQHIRRRGEDTAAGSVIAATGSCLTPGLIALARSAGVTSLEVYARTGVAVVATGAELTEPGADPGQGGIHESNSEMIAALAAQAGCDVVRVETCTDDPELLRQLLDDLDADDRVDLVITTGGVSQGAYEVVRQVCEPLGSFAFVHLAMQPGGPQGLGTYGRTPVVSLPGTPTGAFVSFTMLLRPGLDRLHGVPPREPSTAAYAGKPRRTRRGKIQFLTSVLSPDGTVRTGDAHHLTALARANALIEVPFEVDELVEGDAVTVHCL
ncbi:MAG: molybdopterin molybdotransferase MoeA [Brachybacterium paraconglomeratum]|nr:molybdopterin molybdotransferase MoeA [Brachybacterium paraconglomeratum]